MHLHYNRLQKMTTDTNKPSPRYNYFRAHKHPLGWGVKDWKTKCTIAFGDKNICAAIASLLNGDPNGGSVLKGWPEAFDGWAGSPHVELYDYESETGELIAITKGK